MDPLHKLCPKCGRRTVVQMPQCQECGFRWVADPALNRTVMAAAPAASGAGRLWMWTSGVAMAAILIVSLSVAFRPRHLARLDPPKMLRSTAFPSLTGSGGASDPEPAPGGNGLFSEREGASVVPTINVVNVGPDLMFLTLRDAQGNTYRATSRWGEINTIQVPAGSYTVTVASENPRVHGNSGDAVFRRHKEYDAAFMEGPMREGDDQPLHLGD